MNPPRGWFPCEACGRLTNYREASLVSRREALAEWYIACVECSNEGVYWIDLCRLDGKYRHEGDDSPEGWLQHLSHKNWWSFSNEQSFLAALERKKKLPRPAASRPPPRVPLSKRLRFAVLQRDGFRCVYCGASGAGVRLHVDHVKSRKAGGSDDLSNLRAACADCNHGKGAQSIEER